MRVRFYPMFPPQARLFIAEKPASLAVIDGRALSIPPSAAAEQRLALKLLISRLRIIERVMQASALLAAERRIDNQGSYRSQIAQLEQIDRNFKIPIKLADFPLKISQARARPLQPLVGAHDTN